MDCRAIRPGDLVEVEIRGVSFEATVKSKQHRNLAIEPTDPYHYSWRHCSPRQVKRRLERPAGEKAVT